MGERLAIDEHLAIDADELAFSFIRSPGPGGQNVNKVASAVQLRFDLSGSPSLPQGVKQRAARLAGSRLTAEGVIVITASGSRSQAQNREAAIERLLDLLRAAAPAPIYHLAGFTTSWNEIAATLAELVPGYTPHIRPAPGLIWPLVSQRRLEQDTGFACVHDLRSTLRDMLEHRA